MTATPLILGHRGASACAPENTMAAFSRAIRDGADGIEFDVRLARDRVPVVIHDVSLKRTGSIDRLISELTATELQAIDVGRWFSGAESFAGERLPTLVQVFDFFRTNRGLLYLEMKCDPAERVTLAVEVVRLTREAGLSARVVVESFDLDAIAHVKKIAREIRTAALFEPRLSRPISTVRRLKMVDTVLRLGADEMALHHTLVGDRLIRKARQHGLEIVVWTVEDADWIARAEALGIKALITNNPAALVRRRNKARINS